MLQKNYYDEEKCYKKIIMIRKNATKNNYDEEKYFQQIIKMRKNATKNSIIRSEGIEMPDIYLMKGG